MERKQAEVKELSQELERHHEDREGCLQETWQ